MNPIPLSNAQKPWGDPSMLHDFTIKHRAFKVPSTWGSSLSMIRTYKGQINQLPYFIGHKLPYHMFVT